MYSIDAKSLLFSKCDKGLSIAFQLLINNTFNKDQIPVEYLQIKAQQKLFKYIKSTRLEKAKKFVIQNLELFFPDGKFEGSFLYKVSFEIDHPQRGAYIFLLRSICIYSETKLLFETTKSEGNRNELIKHISQQIRNKLEIPPAFLIQLPKLSRFESMKNNVFSLEITNTINHIKQSIDQLIALQQKPTNKAETEKDLELEYKRVIINIKKSADLLEARIHEAFYNNKISEAYYSRVSYFLKSHIIMRSIIRILPELEWIIKDIWFTKNILRESFNGEFDKQIDLFIETLGIQNVN